MRLVTAETMRALDRRAMEEGGMPGALLMESAGRAVFDYLVERFSPIAERSVIVLCGTGNNGGDGFVVARLLHLAAARAEVFIAGDPSRIAGDAATQLRALRACGVDPRIFDPAAISRPDVAVDALLGTGFEGEPREPVASAIRWINGSGAPVVAVDLPSGVSADTGAAPGDAVRAAATVTFGFQKPGLLLLPGGELAGEVRVSSIGFEWDRLPFETPFRALDDSDVQRLLPPRPVDAHKGMFGHVLVVGGSIGMSGAPSLAALAALRAGAGLVTVAAPSSAQPIIASRHAEVMTVALQERDGWLTRESFGDIQAAAERADALCLGPGAGRSEETAALLLRVIREVDRPIVIDADALIALAGEPEVLAGRKSPAVLTPHPGECAELLQTTTQVVQADRLETAREAARKYRSVVVLKGARTIIADSRNDSALIPISINATGNSGMATAGSGDTLTGITGAMLARGIDAYDAAALAVWLHGRAGDLAAARIGQAGLIAGDIIEALPAALNT